MSTAIATRSEGGTLTIKQRLQSPELINELGKAMPKHCKPERMARIAMTALTRTPKLGECTQASFFKCLLDLSQWGLEPDGRRAHLIPYENRRAGTVECQLIVDYKGYVELAYRSGVVRNIHADVVREGDIFVYSTGRVIKHVPHFLRQDESKPLKEGNIFAVYCQVELVGDTTKTEVLSKAEVESIRKRSRAGNSGPWVTDWNEMAKKTAFRRASKWIPLSAEMRDAFEQDGDTLVEGSSTSHGHRPPAATLEDLGTLLAGDADPGVIEGEFSTTEHPTDPIAEVAAKLDECGTLEQFDQTVNDLPRYDLSDDDDMRMAQMIEQRRASLESAVSKALKRGGK